MRHGETDWNKDHIFQGHNDIPLNSKGREQAHQRRESLKLPSNIKSFSSPLIRAKETAIIVTNNQPEIEVIPEFMECNSPETARYLLEKKGVTEFPRFEKLNTKGDSPKIYLQKVKEGLEKMFQTSGVMIPLLFAHGGTCTAICEILGIQHFKVSNCELFYFELVDNKYRPKKL